MLGPLEAVIMSVVWSSRVGVSVGDVVGALERRRKPAAYSTIKTVLTNLANKGCLTKHWAGRASIFAATRSRESFERDAVGGVVDSLLRNHRNALLTHLAAELANDPWSIATFERLLDERRRGRVAVP
jgi:predicted transcriptional regulator